MVNLEKLVILKLYVGDENAPITLPCLKFLISTEMTLLKVLTMPVLEQLSIFDWKFVSEPVATVFYSQIIMSTSNFWIM